MRATAAAATAVLAASHDDCEIFIWLRLRRRYDPLYDFYGRGREWRRGGRHPANSLMAASISSLKAFSMQLSLLSNPFESPIQRRIEFGSLIEGKEAFLEPAAAMRRRIFSGFYRRRHRLLSRRPPSPSPPKMHFDPPADVSCAVSKSNRKDAKFSLSLDDFLSARNRLISSFPPSFFRPRCTSQRLLHTRSKIEGATHNMAGYSLWRRGGSLTHS